MRLNFFNLEDINLVQIQIVDNNEDFEVLSDSAKYLDSSVFSIFIHCFELSKPDFDYSKENLFNNTQIVTLRNHLLTQLTRILNISNEEDLKEFALHQISGIEFMNELKTLYQNWRIMWEAIRDKLAAINKSLIEMVDSCIDEDRELLVRGY